MLTSTEQQISNNIKLNTLILIDKYVPYPLCSPKNNYKFDLTIKQNHYSI